LHKFGERLGRQRFRFRGRRFFGDLRKFGRRRRAGQFKFGKRLGFKGRFRSRQFFGSLRESGKGYDRQFRLRIILSRRFLGGRIEKNDKFGKFRFRRRQIGKGRFRRFSGRLFGGQFRQGREKRRILRPGRRGTPAGKKNGEDQERGEKQLHGTCSIISSTTALIIPS
jgi:hypothetical protein